MVVAPPAVPAASPDTCPPSTTLATFLQLLCARPAAEVVDLGGVVGANITFLGDRIGCKIHVEDLYADLDRHARQDGLDQVAVFLKSRFSHLDESIDAILCWDVFDYLDRAAAHVLARESMRMLRPAVSCSRSSARADRVISATRGTASWTKRISATSSTPPPAAAGWCSRIAKSSICSPSSRCSIPSY